MDLLGQAIAQLFVKIGADNKDLDKGLSDADRKLVNWSQKVGRIGTALTKNLTLPIVAGLTLATREIMKQEEAEAQLAAALGVTGAAAAAAMKKYNEFASSIQKTTIYGDDAILSAMAYGKNLGIQEDQLEAAAKAAVGLAAKYRIDLNSAMQLIGRASQGQTAMLARYGIVLDANLSPQEKFNKLLEIGAGSFGLAEAAAKTSGGQLKQLVNSLGDAGESIAVMLLPYIKAGAAWLRKFVEQLQEMSPAARKAIITTLLLAAAVGPLMKLVVPIVKLVVWFHKIGGMAGVIAKIGPAFTVIRTAIAAMTGPVGWIIGALAIIIPLVIKYRKEMGLSTENLRKGWERVREAFARVWNNIRPSLASLWESIKKIAKALEPFVKMLLKVAGAQLGVTFAGLGLILKAIAWIVEKVALGISNLIDLVTRLLNLMSRGSQSPTLLDRLLDRAIKATEVAKDHARVLKEQAAMAKLAAEEEAKAVLDVLQKRREAFEEEKNRRMQAIGWGSSEDIYRKAQEAGRKLEFAGGPSAAASGITAQNLPNDQKLGEILQSIKKQERDQAELLKITRERLGRYAT